MTQSSVGHRLHAFTREEPDLLVVLAVSLITIPLALLTGGPVRIAFAIPFVIFIPGYCLIAALYPRKDSLDNIERLALSFGTSIAVVPLIGLVLNYTPWGIRLVPILVGVTCFIVAMCGIAWFRRRRLQPQERYSVQFTLPEVAWRGMKRTDRILTVAVVASFAFAVGALVYVIAVPKDGEQFTEFYILGTSGMAEGYPDTLRAGEGADLILGVVNHEGEPVEYTVQVRLDGDSTTAQLQTEPAAARQVEPYTLLVGPLDDEEKWEHPVTVTALVPGERLKLELLLFSPRLREGYNLRALLAGDGYTSVEVHEAKGRATVTLQAGEEPAHDCRIEAWQGGQLVAQDEIRVESGEERSLDFRYPPGETLFRVYDGGALVLDDSGAELSLHLWVDVT